MATKKSRQEDRYDGYIQEYNDPNTSAERKTQLEQDIENLILDIDNKKLRNKISESWGKKQTTESFDEQQDTIDEQRAIQDKFLEQFNKMYEDYPEYQQSPYLSDIKNVLDKAAEQGADLFTNTEEFVKNNADATGQAQINEIVNGINSAVNSYQTGGDTMLSSFAKTYNDSEQSLNQLYNNYSGNVANAMNDYKQNSSLAEQSLSAVLGMYQNGGQDMLNKYNQSAQNVADFYQSGGQGLYNAYQDAVNVVGQGMDTALNVYKNGFDEQLRQTGIGQQRLEDGINSMKSISAENKTKIYNKVKAGTEAMNQGVSTIKADVSGTGQQLETLYGNQVGQAQTQGDVVSKMANEGGQAIAKSAEQGLGEALGTATEAYQQGLGTYAQASQQGLDTVEQGLQQGLSQYSQQAGQALGDYEKGLQQGLGTYEKGVTEGLGKYEQGLAAKQEAANRNQLPGQDLLEDKYAAQTQRNVEQIKELGGGSAGSLSAIAKTLSGQDESMRDIAIEAARMKQENQADYANSLLGASSVYQNAYGNLGQAQMSAAGNLMGAREGVAANQAQMGIQGSQNLGQMQATYGQGLAGAQMDAGSALSSMMQNQVGMMSDIYSQNLARDMAAQQYGYDVNQQAVDQHGNVLQGNLANRTAANQLGIQTAGDTMNTWENMYRNNAATDLGIGQYGTSNIVQMQQEYANLIGKGAENMTALEQQRATQLGSALQGMGGAAAQAGEMGAQGQLGAAQLYGQGYNQYTGDIANAQNNMANYYNQRGSDLSSIGINAAGNMANMGMQGINTMNNLGTQYGQAAYQVGTGLGNLYNQGAGQMADAYGNYGNMMNNAYLNSANLGNQYLNNWQQGQLGYYNTAQSELDKQYQYNQLSPWTQQAGFAEKGYWANDPYASQMGLYGDQAGIAYANAQQAIAAENARKAANAQIWGGVAQGVGNIVGSLIPSGA